MKAAVPVVTVRPSMGSGQKAEDVEPAEPSEGSGDKPDGTGQVVSL